MGPAVRKGLSVWWVLAEQQSSPDPDGQPHRLDAPPLEIRRVPADPRQPDGHPQHLTFSIDTYLNFDWWAGVATQAPTPTDKTDWRVAPGSRRSLYLLTLSLTITENIPDLDTRFTSRPTLHNGLISHRALLFIDSTPM